MNKAARQQEGIYEQGKLRIVGAEKEKKDLRSYGTQATAEDKSQAHLRVSEEEMMWDRSQADHMVGKEKTKAAWGVKSMECYAGDGRVVLSPRAKNVSPWRSLEIGVK